MIKGTRMIVITKNKIIATLAVIALLGVCTGSILKVSHKKTINAFSSYENILDEQFTPAKNADRPSEIAEKVKNKLVQIPKSILKYYFGFSENQKKEEPQIVPEQSEPLITSESKSVADTGMKVSNSTDFEVNPQQMAAEQLTFAVDDNGPQVLIVHTHTTESYSEENYIKGAPDRNLDETKNITAVGEAMCDVFEKNMIPTYHDITVHDYPSYNGAYQRAATTISNDIEKYKGIKVVLDVHRDGITKEDGTKVKLVTDINGVKTAQVMLVVGTNATLKHDFWRENMKFASKIQQKAQSMYPTLMRPIDLRQERFNQQLTKGSVIIEIGTNGNTMEEALEGGKAIAEVISSVLKE